MIHTHTIVVRYPEGIAPRYSAATEFQGGQVVAVDFDGNRLHICQELEEALENLRAQCADTEAALAADLALANARKVKQ